MRAHDHEGRLVVGQEGGWKKEDARNCIVRETRPVAR
jgi:hypothetical protein